MHIVPNAQGKVRGEGEVMGREGCIISYQIPVGLRRICGSHSSPLHVVLEVKLSSQQTHLKD